mmetsp:Transcript_29511/g.62634  ORF Transcript_29511/g.62634 Transcript_29511/m.62634 type:complete len:129 (-) Transcript_29511:38-424(-)
MRHWEETMPPSLMIPGHASKSETMRALGITPQFVNGIQVGDWHSLTMRMMQADDPVNHVNTPPLRAGDYVEVLPGNSVKWATVGKHATLMEYFGDDDKWGIDLTGIPSLVKAGNLKRIARNPDERGDV